MKAIHRQLMLSLALVAASLSILVAAPAAYGNVYGSGIYGACQYSSCSITLTSSGSITDAITPVSGTTTCTVANDVINVTTGSSTGYTVSLIDGDTSNQLSNGAGSYINATSGTLASPTLLSANSWGYRVDGVGGFGAGPTSGIASDNIPTLPFAAVPISSGASDIIVNSSSAAGTGASTNVWYGTCVDLSLPNGNYADNVTYTALTQ